jgi:hypothetical protein
MDFRSATEYNLSAADGRTTSTAPVAPNGSFLSTYSRPKPKTGSHSRTGHRRSVQIASDHGQPILPTGFARPGGDRSRTWAERTPIGVSHMGHVGLTMSAPTAPPGVSSTLFNSLRRGCRSADLSHSQVQPAGCSGRVRFPTPKSILLREHPSEERSGRRGSTLCEPFRSQPLLLLSRRKDASAVDSGPMVSEHTVITLLPARWSAAEPDLLSFRKKKAVRFPWQALDG